jgi:predicted Zn-dependent protease
VARTDWAGAYLDGHSPVRQPARIQVLRGGLQITRDSGESAWWPIAEIRQAQGRYQGEEVRLERGHPLPETLVVADPAFLESLVEISPDAASKFHDPRRRSSRRVHTILAGVAVVVVIGALYLWGIPALADVVSARVPVAWEESLGASAVEQLAGRERRCTEAARQKTIEGIVARLASANHGSPYTFRVFVMNEPVVNAFAAPGGFIVLYRGLLERTKTPEELAGVLAHEMQHVVRRHATKALVQHASTGLLLVAVSGDITGVMAYGLETARVLGSLQYSRLAEEEADREGMRLILAAGIDPVGMIAFFEGMEKEQRDGRGLLKYLSTHPPSKDRIRRLQGMVRERPPATRPLPLLPDYDWADIRHICPAAKP